MADHRWYLYMLRCHGAPGAPFYVGVTTDIGRRVAEHSEGPRGARYTRARRPVSLAASWGPFDKVTAHRLEHRMKRLTRAEKVRALDLTADALVALLLCCHGTDA